MSRCYRFVDHARVTVFSGSGGDGVCKFVKTRGAPAGGPDGGDGGRGGDVLLRASDRRRDLRHISGELRAPNGENGKPSRGVGKSGEPVVLEVPIGTMVREQLSRQLLHDLDSATDKDIVLLSGGRGGAGNARFKNSTNQAPMKTTRGAPSQKLALDLELKLIADIGLVGYPNAGKSSFLGATTRNKPHVANYPFTTLNPWLGHVAVGGFPSYCIADIPGLIEGAHIGEGLGHTFLRHVERTKALAFVIAAEQAYKGTSDHKGVSPTVVYSILVDELERHLKGLSSRGVLVLLNKVDLLTDEECTDLCNSLSTLSGLPVFPISALHGKGLEGPLEFLAQHLHILQLRRQVEMERIAIETRETSDVVLVNQLPS
eukprot:TRINITY_DN11895_c0_g1_i2.p2 TRINITY_DN11895_c0_g1~~TRINITY_DN11895_c0_g1_i2.p2  ORF type:complete len:373 (+),score=54.34 TRINITY_DN11895_c0_g1_i2:1558-2676(+)